jgi:hypothetical protein
LAGIKPGIPDNFAALETAEVYAFGAVGVFAFGAVEIFTFGAA